ncbi:hypothetical protein ASPCADRAFT_4845 [Aspergillus carbonarius ITEM 5010]|uniref:MYND-type domain-containing protein n=1 Tax=Aspergillus carbonarius (strain ITEM 5010) TaxID=602072 RepID=A0A1R3RQN9_ASPC5|nr:hypothetical protein ASPCADRAFT_4845 [Aspergillus carbonarius ITEM 5010]
MPSKTLPSGCTLCGKMENLQRCSKCNLMPYCSSYHKALDYPNHNDVCARLSHFRVHLLDDPESSSESDPDDSDTIDDSDSEWLEGSYFDTEPPLVLMLTLWEIYHVEAVTALLQQSFKMLADILYINGATICRVPQQIPQLMLRLGKDEDCYGYVKYAARKAGERFLTCQPGPPFWFKDPSDDNPFEAFNYTDHQFWDPSHMIAFTLLKIKFLLDLQRMEECEAAVGPRVPTEILFIIQSYVPLSSIVSGKAESFKRRARRETIKELDVQVEELYQKVKVNYATFWCSETVLVHENYFSWAETPGAIHVIKDKVLRDEVAS